VFLPVKHAGVRRTRQRFSSFFFKKIAPHKAALWLVFFLFAHKPSRTGLLTD
jgi:hypothetical protein